MRSVYKLILFFLFITVNVTAQVPANNIPPFKFFRLDKTAFLNKDLILNQKRFFIFFDSECDHCKHAIQAINKHSNEFKKTTLYILSLDSPEKMKFFLTKNGPGLLKRSNVILLQDMNDEFVKDFGPRKYPSMFLYMSNNKLLIYSDDEKDLPKFIKLTN